MHISAGSWLWEQVALMPRPALFSASGCPSSPQPCPQPCLLAGAWEGTVGTSQTAWVLSWPSLVVAFRLAWVSGSRGSWLITCSRTLAQGLGWQGKLPFNQRSAPRGCQGPGSTLRVLGWPSSGPGPRVGGLCLLP